MISRWGMICILIAGFQGPALSVPQAAPQPMNFEKELLPQIIDVLTQSLIAASSDPHPPRYASLALGKNEYVYSLTDRKFIRMIKDRYELPPWRLCGDWASVRVALLGESMDPVVPETVWYLAYRDDHWVRLTRDDDGNFFRDGSKADLPPYAIRCFNLDHAELTDQ